MAQLPAKTTSREIQKEHIRTYDSGKKTLVNRGNRKFLIKPKTILKLQTRVEQKKQESPNEQASLALRPKIRPSEEEQKQIGKMGEHSMELTVSTMTFPTIAFTGWEEMYPQPLKDKLQMARMIQLMKDPKDYEEFATDEEALGYMSTASLAGPLDRDAAEVMMYLFNKVMPKASIPDDVKFTKQLEPQQEQLLKRLKRDIRKSQWEVFKKRMKEEKNAQT